MSRTKNPTKRSATKGAQPKNTKPKRKDNNRSALVAPGKLSAAPVAQQRQQRMRKPVMRSTPGGDCHIKHREYIADLVAEASSPSLFKTQGFPIQPGVSGTFPWLSQIAPRFEKYRFNSLKFCFETEAPTSLGGSLILTVDYDASDPAPTSKVQAMAYKNAVRSAPWEECCHMSAKEDLSQQKAYFVRTAAAPNGTDVKLYDVGNLFACSQNIVTGGATLGELYVEYDILLMTPQLQSGGESGTDASKLVGGDSMTPALPLGLTPTISNSLVNPLVDYDNGTATLTFKRAGVFTIGVDVKGTGLTSLGVNFGTFKPLMSSTISATSITAMGSTGIQANIGDTLQIAVGGTTVTSSTLAIYEFF